MALETVPASSQSDGRWRVTYLPSTAPNPLSIATLNGGTAKPLTYSFTPDGFNYTIAQETVADPRLTLIQNLSRPGKKTETLETKFVASSDAGSAAAILTEGVAGYLVIRRGVDAATDYTVGQKVDVITFLAGADRPDAPAENAVDTISKTLYITEVTQRQATTVA